MLFGPFSRCAAPALERWQEALQDSYVVSWCWVAFSESFLWRFVTGTRYVIEIDMVRCALGQGSWNNSHDHRIHTQKNALFLFCHIVHARITRLACFRCFCFKAPVGAVIRASGLRWKSTRHRFLTAFAQAHSISLLNLVKPSNQFRSKNKSSPIWGHHPQEKPVIVVGVHERGNRGRHRGWPQVPPDDVYWALQQSCTQWKVAFGRACMLDVREDLSSVKCDRCEAHTDAVYEWADCSERRVGGNSRLCMKCVNSGCEWRNRHFLYCHERPLIANKGTGETDETDIVTAADTRQEWKQSFQGRQGMFFM